MTIPVKINAGDRLQFDYSDPLYPPESWTGKFTIRNSRQVYSVDLTNNGSGGFLCDADTSTWEAGEYTGFLTVTSGSVRNTAYMCNFLVAVDPLSGTADDRTHIKRTLDIIESVIEGRVAQDTVSYSIAGRSISKMSPEQLIAFHDRYLNLYAQEVRNQKAANGQKVSTKIKVRFR